MLEAKDFLFLLPLAGKLELLFLSHTRISHQATLLLLKAAPRLKHVDLSACPVLPDELCRVLGSTAR